MERNRNMLTAGLTLAFAVGTLGGCATAPTKVATPAPAPAQPAAAQQKPAAAPVKPVLEGKVVETMDGGGYTYVLVEKDGKKSWTAIPQTEVKVGQEIALIPGIDMGTFTSNTLKRTFDNIHFSSGIKGEAVKTPPQMKKTAAAADPTKLPSGHPALPQGGADAAKLPAGHPALPQGGAAAAPAAAAADNLTGTVVESLNAGGYTYLNIEKDGKKTWAAIPQEDVTVGSKVAVQQGAVMPSFTSKSLNRTFENIVFSPGLAK